MSTKPITTIRVTAEYVVCTETEITLPEGRTWADIQSWYIKWNTFHATFRDGRKFVYVLNDVTPDDKYPDSYGVSDLDGNDLEEMR
ncbi:hypothetical protein [uncultured Halomonas sp.]|mgnify:CR=1 FL=1|uniref:hypothetical protein n=1 Tax=uncultured Halomonas sp. TaxID=173971 RepID=UPI0026374CD3|nr:hypothetical protein [uncultured Halomonas sp.]